MQNHAAVFREGDTLKKGCALMDDIFQGQKDLKVNVTFSSSSTDEPLFIDIAQRSWSNLEYGFDRNVGIAKSSTQCAANRLRR